MIPAAPPITVAIFRIWCKDSVIVLWTVPGKGVVHTTLCGYN